MAEVHVSLRCHVVNSEQFIRLRYCFYIEYYRIFQHLTISNITLTRCYGNAGNHFLRFRRASASFLSFSSRLADSSVIVTLPSKTHPGRPIIQSVFNFLHLSVSKSWCLHEKVIIWVNSGFVSYYITCHCFDFVKRQVT